MRQLSTFLFAILAFSVFYSCSEDGFVTDPNSRLTLRQDTLWFDTVFTSFNDRHPQSVNKQIVLVNPYKRILKTSVTLAGGAQSHFIMNVDGLPGYHFEEVEILPEDSLFIFVEVHPSPNNNHPDFNPLIIRDSVLFRTNGNEQQVNLIGWGQDAHYIFRDSIETDTSWSNTALPIVVYGYCYVKPGVKLTVEPGMQVHFAPRSWLYVEGNLDIRGSAQDPVVMQGDRLQPDWEETAGQWGGIWFDFPSRNNRIEHALIKNGTVGVYCDTISGDQNVSPTVRIYKTHIRNMLYDGVASRGSHLRMENSLINNCGRFTFLASFGGIYDLRHCTFDMDSRDFARRDPSFAVLNIHRDAFGNILSEHPIDFYMANSVVNGNFEDGEVYLDLNSSANYTIEYNLLKTQLKELDANNNIVNESPLFTAPFKNDFTLDEGSPAKDMGKVLIPAITDDLRGKVRDGQPDMGAYESDH